MRYHFINTMLLNELQKQERRIESQEETIKAQAAQIEQLSAQAQQIESLTARLAKLKAAQRQRRVETVSRASRVQQAHQELKRS